MTELQFALFDSPIGRCGIAWSQHGVAAVQLPEAGEARTHARLLKRCPGARAAPPPPAIQRVVDGIVALLRGEAPDLSTVPLDLEQVPGFDRQVYQAARAIPPGGTLTYGALAARVGAAGLAREVGQALGRNPIPLLVPCHRVLAAGGQLGGFSAYGGLATKRRLLELEGAPIAYTLDLFGDDARADRQAGSTTQA